MARRLKETGYDVTAVYDAHHPLAETIAKELGCAAPTTLAGVTALADVILTVVTDDKAMYKIFSPKGDSLLVSAKGRVFINCATVSPKVHVDVEKLSKKDTDAKEKIVS